MGGVIVMAIMMGKILMCEVQLILIALGILRVFFILRFEEEREEERRLIF